MEVNLLCSKSGDLNVNLRYFLTAASRFVFDRNVGTMTTVAQSG